MKHLFILFWSIAAVAAYGAGTNISRYPNTTSLQPGDTFIIERPGDTNYNVTAAQMPGELGVQPTNANLTDWAGWGTNAYANVVSNRAVSGLSGSAFKGTNAFDLAGTGIAVTNGFPWGVLYDASGAGTTAATAATNNFKDGRNLTNLLHSSTVTGVSGVTVALTQNADGSTNYGLTVTAGGGGNVTGSGSTATGEVPTFNNGSATGIQGGGVLLANVTTNTGNLSGMVKGNGARGITGASAGSDYVAPSTTLTINGTANQITSSAGAQDLSANRTVTLSVPSAFTGPGSVSATTFFGLDQWLIGTNAANHQLVISNTTYGGNLTLTTNGTFAINGNPLLGASTLGASQYVATDASTNLVSTQNGNNWTNWVAYTHEGTTTNINIAFNGTVQSFTVTNGPDVWLNWSGANGSAAVQFLTNVSVHSSTTFNKFLAGSNGVSTGVYKITNGWFTVTSAGGTNNTQLSPAIVENQ